MLEAWQNKIWLDQKHEASLLGKSPKSFLSGGIFLLGAWDCNIEVIYIYIYIYIFPYGAYGAKRHNTTYFQNCHQETIWQKYHSFETQYCKN